MNCLKYGIKNLLFALPDEVAPLLGHDRTPWALSDDEWVLLGVTVRPHAAAVAGTATRLRDHQLQVT